MSAPTPAQIAERRRALGISQQQLAELIRVGRVVISRWENGVTPLSPKRATQADVALDALETGFRYAAIAAATAGSEGDRGA